MAGLLSNVEILNAIASGEVVFDPQLSRDQIRPAGVQLSLGRVAWKTRPKQHTIILSGESPKLEIAPRELVTFTVRERVRLSNKHSARIGTLPYFNELGLLIFPGLQVEPGFEGRLTVSGFNFNPSAILIKYGSPICLLEVSALSAPASMMDVRRALNIDVESAIDTLEATPHSRQQMDDKSRERVRKILEKIDSQKVIDTEYRDSEHLSRFIHS